MMKAYYPQNGLRMAEKLFMQNKKRMENQIFSYMILTRIVISKSQTALISVICPIGRFMEIKYFIFQKKMV
jgi:hypothetical protein